MTPTLDNANYLASKVMDQIDADRCGNRENLQRTILEGLLYLHAVEPKAEEPAANSDLRQLASTLLDALCRDRGYTCPSPEVLSASLALTAYLASTRR